MRTRGCPEEHVNLSGETQIGRTDNDDHYVCTCQIKTDSSNHGQNEYSRASITGGGPEHLENGLALAKRCFPIELYCLDTIERKDLHRWKT